MESMADTNPADIGASFGWSASGVPPPGSSGYDEPGLDANPTSSTIGGGGCGPSLEPYGIARLERFELFSTNQCYYIVGSNKLNSAYRIIKIDRTLIERPNINNSNSNNQSYPSQSNVAPSISASRSYGGGTGSSSPRRPYPSSSSGGNSHVGDFGVVGSEVPAVQSSASNISNANNATSNTATDSDGQHTANPKSRPLSDFVSEDPNLYTQEEIKDMLDMIHDGNRMTRSNGGHSNPSMRHRGSGGGLKPIVKAYGIVGFIRFLDCYYLTLITKRAKVGSIGGNGIYTIKNTETIPLKPAERQSEMDELDPSSVLLSMWNRGKRSVGLGLSNREIAELRYQGIYQVLDLSKSFFFSYTYDLTRTLQENMLATTSRPFPPPPCKDTFAWNYFLTREFEGCLNSDNSYHWVLPIVHGAFVQRKIQDYGRSLDLMLIARRSRHFAGTRYLKRGVSDQGKVANDVEHEQILEDNDSSTGAGGEAGASTFCSFIQVRGSIPTFWTQESSVTMPKPPIELNRVDPTYKATREHFEDLFQRYSTPVLVLDLVKQSEKRAREVLVGNEYRHAVEYINDTIDSDKHKILYCSFDYSHTSKHRQLDVSSSLSEVSTWAVNQTGFFCSNPKWKMKTGGILEPFAQQDRLLAQLLSDQLGIPVFPMEQSGVLRTNCIDCLDRTNVAQFSAGVEAIAQQLVVMGIRSQSKLDPSSNIVRVLIDMYVDIGDSIALQYGGSEAHKKVTASHAESNIMPIGKHKELLTSIRRYYSNAFTDRLKQDAINLFLGFYVPYMHTEPLWEMESDYYLHNFHVKEGRGMNSPMDFYRRSFGIQPTDGRDALALERPQRSSRNSSVDTVTSFRKPSMYAVSSGTTESQRVANVRKRVVLQNKILSIWWKRALHSSLQQRIWMKHSSTLVGGASYGMDAEASLLPPRYERLYQPEKMAQFDRFFARGWATPLRSSHSAQHTEERNDGPENGAGYFSRVIMDTECSACFANKGLGQAGDEPKDDYRQRTSIRKFLEISGYEAPFESSSKLFVDPHDHRAAAARANLDFVGNLYGVSESSIPEEYKRYCTPSTSLFSTPYSTNERVKTEFESVLKELSLQADDVDGICALSESAHLSRTILSGPYRGLSSDDSAIEFATALHEQFNPMESAMSRSPVQIDEELKRRGFDANGVMDSVEAQWESFRTSEDQYTEILDHPARACRRSDLTTPTSLKQYISLYDYGTQLSTLDEIFLTGRKTKKVGPPVLTQSPPAVGFTQRASRLGIDIGSHSEKTQERVSSLYPTYQTRAIPASFEQINNDMFARKDNQFMVFNFFGMQSFGPLRNPEPETKILQPDDFFFYSMDVS